MKSTSYLAEAFDLSAQPIDGPTSGKREIHMPEENRSGERS